MSDRIAVMHHGRIEQLGTPEALYERPATTFVADFIGTTNLLRGTVEGLEADAAQIRLESGDLCRIGRPGRDVGQVVDVSVRPEAIAIRADRNGGSAERGISATIQQTAYLGSAVQYLVRTKGGVVLTVLASRSADRLAVDEAVVLDWAPGDALVLGDRPAGLEDTT
jgi:spermidine/putrescine transport system ATP-binding protein